VRILLDTHCWLWMVGRPDRLSPSSRSLVEDAENELLLSAASSWEIAIKHGIGKLRLPGDPVTLVPEWMARSGVVALPVHHAHALAVAHLPRHHGDPFDRLLVAQAQLEDLPLLTADNVFQTYDLRVIRA
jgi:PIN domain nuclease of toxin-antitoxin system